MRELAEGPRDHPGPSTEADDWRRKSQGEREGERERDGQMSDMKRRRRHNSGVSMIHFNSSIAQFVPSCPCPECSAAVYPLMVTGMFFMFNALVQAPDLYIDRRKRDMSCREFPSPSISNIP